MRMVDLSQDIYQGMQVYPGHLKTVVFDHATHAETAVRFEGGFSFQTKGFMINDNGPTHVDSFSHLDPDPSAETIDQMSLDLFYGPAVCLDVSHVPAHQDITAEHNSARSRLQDARAERRSLLRRLANAITQQEVDSLKSQLRDVNARITQAKTDLARVSNRAGGAES